MTMWKILMAPWMRGAQQFRERAQQTPTRRLRQWGGGLVVLLLLGAGLVDLRLTTWGYGLIGLTFFGLADYLQLCWLRRYHSYWLGLLVSSGAAFVIVAAESLGLALLFHD